MGCTPLFLGWDHGEAESKVALACPCPVSPVEVSLSLPEDVEIIHYPAIPSCTAMILMSFPQNGRNHTALEVPAGVVVLLSVVRGNRRPELGPQVLIGAGHGAHGHPIQDEVLFQPQRTLAAARHPNHSRFGEPLRCEWRVLRGRGGGRLPSALLCQDPCDTNPIVPLQWGRLLGLWEKLLAWP